MLSLVGAIGADIPVDIGRDDARRAALRELAKPVYQEAKPSLTVRAMRWLLEHAGRLLDLADSAPGGPFGIVLLGIIALVIVLLIRFGVGPFARITATDSVVFSDVARNAADHRAAADTAAAAGDWAVAVRERFRAVIRQLEEDGRLDGRPARTADEAAADAGRSLPAHAADLRAGARIFDEVLYGEHPASATQDQRLRALDDAIRASRRSRTTVGAG
jgi:hypothetical protein